MIFILYPEEELKKEDYVDISNDMNELMKDIAERMSETKDVLSFRFRLHFYKTEFFQITIFMFFRARECHPTI